MPDLELLRAAAPPTAAPTPDARAAARATLERHAAGARAPRTSHRRRWLVLAGMGAAAACAVALALTVRGDEPASAATTALRHAAAAAERQPALPPLQAGQYVYTHSSDLMMTFAEGGEPAASGEPAPMFGVIMPVDRQIWRDTAGGGWLRQKSGAATFLSDHDRALWIAAGRPDLGDRNEDTALGGDQGGDAPMATLTLTDDPDAIRRELEDGLGSDADGASRGPLMFSAVGDYLRETATTPAQRAALYKVAASIDGVELLGSVVDKAGRTGTAVAIDDAEQGVRHTLVFDPSTGVLLEERDVTLAGNGYGYAAGVTVGRSTYLESRIVDKIPAR